MRKIITQNTLLFGTLLAMFSCKDDRGVEEDNGLTSITIENHYSIVRFKVLNISSGAKESSKVEWYAKVSDGNNATKDSLLSQMSTLEFISPYAKNYDIILKVYEGEKVMEYPTKISVMKESLPYSKYIADVLEYRPAVGQFVNKMPSYEQGNTAEDLRQKARKALLSNEMISLGGYGGYVVFGFDHTIPNLEGRDFKILGNAFWANASQDARSGSCEPGIIMVAYDKNKNGKPDDDEWYEIAGSEYFKDKTIKNYQITYYKPNDNKLAVPGASWQTDTQYIRWEDNQGDSGYKSKIMFHTQSYYPLWITDTSYTFRGTKLENNFYDQSGTGNYWVGKSYAYGYADNAPNNDEASNIDISWAVDAYGNYVKLPGIDFVKVYTGVNQEAGWLGEVSTEVAGAYNIYMK